jgi:hypothetical protein
MRVSLGTRPLPGCKHLLGVHYLRKHYNRRRGSLRNHSGFQMGRHFWMPSNGGGTVTASLLMPAFKYAFSTLQYP